MIMIPPIVRAAYSISPSATILYNPNKDTASQIIVIGEKTSDFRKTRRDVITTITFPWNLSNSLG